MDATFTDGFGKMVNDSGRANCKMKVVVVDGQPKLCLFANKPIEKDTELRFDYGVKDLPWRKYVSIILGICVNCNYT